MRSITLRRRHPAAGYAVVLAGLVIAGLCYAAVTGIGAASAASQRVSGGPLIAEGRNLFMQECSECHGLFAQGTPTWYPQFSSAVNTAINGAAKGQITVDQAMQNIAEATKKAMSQ